MDFQLYEEVPLDRGAVYVYGHRGLHHVPGFGVCGPHPHQHRGGAAAGAALASSN